MAVPMSCSRAWITILDKHKCDFTHIPCLAALQYFQEGTAALQQVRDEHKKATQSIANIGKDTTAQLTK